MIGAVGQKVTSAVREMGAMGLFFAEVVGAFFRRGPSWELFHQIVDQMYAVGVRSLSTTVVTGLFVGAIMAVQINCVAPARLREFARAGSYGVVRREAIVAS